MIHIIQKLAWSLLGIMFCLQFSHAQQANERPKLVVGIVVDQMRNEYVHRFYDDFGDDGFKRLIENGYYYSNLHYNYMPTYTAPGHATVYTGAVPNVHGMVGNYWYHKGLQKEIYCTADDSFAVVGGEGRGMSCMRLATSTISDELKMSTNERGKVIGVSIKDRGAILPAGHMGDGAYWFTDEGTFVSSKYYMEELPQWVQAFNDKKLPLEYIKKGWEKTAGISFDESLPDDNKYESLLGGKATPTFPYDLSNLIKSGGIGSMRSTPYGNDLVLEFAKQALLQEKLGQDDIVDMLAVSFSSPDYVGHAMGPRAIETQDTYIRLDKTIASLLYFLDEQVGEGNYLIFLTADHGAAEVPAYLKDRKFDVSTLHTATIKEELMSYSIDKYGENIIKNFSNFNVYINDDVVFSKKLNRDDVIKDLSDYLMQMKFVRRVYTQEQILAGNSADSYLTKIFNGYDPKQNGDLVVLFHPAYLAYKDTGTSHGSPYNYDTHVPLIWFGWKVPQGRNYSKKSITQIAPTLSQLINIGMPNGTEAEVLTEILH